MTLPDHIARPARVEDCKWVYGFVCELEQCDFDYPGFKGGAFVAACATLITSTWWLKKRAQCQAMSVAMVNICSIMAGWFLKFRNCMLKKSFGARAFSQFLIQRAGICISTV